MLKGGGGGGGCVSGCIQYTFNLTELVAGVAAASKIGPVIDTPTQGLLLLVGVAVSGFFIHLFLLLPFDSPNFKKLRTYRSSSLVTRNGVSE